MARLRRPVRPVILAPAPPVHGPAADRRRAAFERAWPLMTTTIPTRQITDAYLVAVLGDDDEP